jgi:RNA polymerase sigma-70 factor (ECF subfamily)
MEQLYADERGALVAALTMAAGDRASAEDAVQDAFAQALLHWDRIGGYAEPVAWIHRVATNRILNQRRSVRRRDAAVERLRAVAGGAASPSASAGERTDLAVALAALPVRQRTAVALFYLADLPAVAVGEAMGITDGAVRFHLHAARQALGPLLEVTG